jgi:vacuolar-type H+-ATPase subunit C/Vma6
VLDILFDPNSPFLWILIIAIIAGAMAVISRPFLAYVKFVYPNAKFEAIGNPYLLPSNLQHLIDASSLEDFIEQLNTNKDYQIEGSNTTEVQRSLDQQLTKFINQMKQDSSTKMVPFYSIYKEKKDAFTIKQILHQVHNHGTINPETFNLTTITMKTKSLILKLAEASEDTVPQILRDYGFSDTMVSQVVSDETLPLQIDATVDAFFLQQLEKVKVPYKCKEGKHLYIARYKDILTIKLLLRAKHMNYHEKLCQLLFIGDGYEILHWKFLELCKVESVQQLIENLEGTTYYSILKQSFEKTDEQSVQTLTTALELLFTRLVKEISQQYYTTIGPTLRFLVSKETEIQNLKIISKGVSEHLSSDLITPLCVLEVDT